MSQNQLSWQRNFLVSLAKIAPVDCILGNHDINLQCKEQGDSISTIIDTANKFL